MDNKQAIKRTLDNHYHFIGIGGIGMSALARILLARSVEVSGSDLKGSYVTEMLKNHGAKVFLGHSAENISKSSTIVYTTGLSEHNPELLAAKEQGCPLLHRSDLLNALAQDYKLLAVTGTHGKTTTSALLCHVLQFAEQDPAFAVGGVLPQYGSNGEDGSGHYFVVEACESDGTFLKYRPFGAIVTNVDFDHLDYYGSAGALIGAFQAFTKNVFCHEHLFWCGDDARLKEMTPPGQSYGFYENCDLHINHFEQEGWNIHLSLSFKGKSYPDIIIPMIGKHNALNAAAVFGMCLSLGIEEATIRQAFLNFSGIKRRVEPKGEKQGILFLDDYAHHPEEIKTTLKAIKEAIGSRRLIAVYQPHRYSRTKDCLGLYSSVFDHADEVILTEIYSAGEQKIEGITDELVFQDISLSSNTPIIFSPKKQLVDYLSSHLKPHDVLVTVGAGDVTEISNAVLEKFKQNSPKKLRLGLIFGGRSGEHKISLISARNIAAALHPEYYELEYFYIGPTGHWESGQKAKDYLFDKAEVKIKESSVLLSGDIIEKLQKSDVLFPILHGPLGEDGTIQGLFELLSIPYVGCCHRSAAICMDKTLTKELMQQHGIDVVPFLSFIKHQWKNERADVMEAIISDLPFPLYVKPVHLGSTLGVSRAASREELENALRKAFELDSKVIVEREIVGREIEFAVLGNAKSIVFPPGEILADGKIYDYEAKYGSQCAKVQASAELPLEVKEKGISLANKAYQIAGCRGMARVDFFLDVHNKFWMNEINPIPGFTSNSLYPLICQANGITYSDLLDQLVIFALEPK